MKTLVIVLAMTSVAMAQPVTRVVVKQEMVELLPPGNYVTYQSSDIGGVTLQNLRDLARTPGAGKRLVMVCDSGDQASLITTLQVIIVRALSGIETHAIAYKSDGNPEIGRMFRNAKTVNSVDGITVELRALGLP